MMRVFATAPTKLTDRMPSAPIFELIQPLRFIKDCFFDPTVVFRPGIDQSVQNQQNERWKRALTWFLSNGAEISCERNGETPKTAFPVMGRAKLFGFLPSYAPKIRYDLTTKQQQLKR